MGNLNEAYISETIELASASLIDRLYAVSDHKRNETAWDMVACAG